MKLFLFLLLLSIAFCGYLFLSTNSVDNFMYICCRTYGCKISGLCEKLFHYSNLKCNSTVYITSIIGGEQKYCFYQDLLIKD